MKSWWPSRHLQGQAETRRLGPPRPQQMTRSPTVRRHNDYVRSRSVLSESASAGLGNGSRALRFSWLQSLGVLGLHADDPVRKVGHLCAAEADTQGTNSTA